MLARDKALAYYLSGVLHGVFLTLLAGLALAQYGCGEDSVYHKATRGGDGTVYVCASGAQCPGQEEWCWNGSERELENLLGASCHEVGPDERVWPWLVGCRYGCPLPGDGLGCNAHCGCFCP